jgi:uncharacterized membrane protein YfcA
VLSGLFGGLVGNQGGIRAAALLGFDLAPRQLVATATAAALLVDAARVPVYVTTSGPALRTHLGMAALLSAAAIAGTFSGIPLLSRIPPRLYRRVVGALLVALGVALMTTVSPACPP